MYKIATELILLNDVVTEQEASVYSFTCIKPDKSSSTETLCKGLRRRNFYCFDIPPKQLQCKNNCRGAKFL